MFEWIGYLFIGITLIPNIQGRKNKSYIWKIAGLKTLMCSNRNMLIEQDPYFMQLDSTEKKIIYGMQFEVFKILQDKLDFRYELAQPVPSNFGRQEKNGTWTGMTGQIVSNKADMTAMPFFISEDRFQVMDYLTTITFQQVQFLVKTGGKESNWNSIIRPFTFELWVAIIIVTMLTGILLRQIIKYESSNEDGNFRSFLRVIWYLFGTLTNQGGNLDRMKRNPSRFSTTIWLLSVVILVSSYSGTLVSFLTSPVYEYVPTNFDELASSVQNGKFACGTLKGEIISRFLMSSKTGNAKILADHMISNKNFDNAKESSSRVLKGKFAFLAGTNVLVKIQKSSEVGKLLIGEDALITFFGSYGVRKGFPYKKDLNKILSRLLQAGIFDKFDDFRKNVERQITSDVRPLNIEDFLSPFAFLLIGYILCFVCLIIELFIAKRMYLQIQLKKKFCNKIIMDSIGVE